jgi:hypothetical protein
MISNPLWILHLSPAEEKMGTIPRGVAAIFLAYPPKENNFPLPYQNTDSYYFLILYIKVPDPSKIKIILSGAPHHMHRLRFRLSEKRLGTLCFFNLLYCFRGSWKRRGGVPSE